MSGTRSTTEILAQLKTSKAVMNLPLGYVNGYPVITVKNGRVCLVVPYLKYKKTGEVDKTLVYPIRYLVTYSVKDGVVTSVEDLAENKGFAGFDFSAPVGYFRHDAIKELTKTAYSEKQSRLYQLYDCFIDALTEKKNFQAKALHEMKELLSLLIEPSLKPVYKTLYPNFYKNCIG